jgi:hypothetical protein
MPGTRRGRKPLPRAPETGPNGSGESHLPGEKAVSGGRSDPGMPAEASARRNAIDRTRGRRSELHPRSAPIIAPPWRVGSARMRIEARPPTELGYRLGFEPGGHGPDEGAPPPAHDERAGSPPRPIRRAGRQRVACCGRSHLLPRGNGGGGRIDLAATARGSISKPRRASRLPGPNRFFRGRAPGNARARERPRRRASCPDGLAVRAGTSVLPRRRPWSRGPSSRRRRRAPWRARRSASAHNRTCAEPPATCGEPLSRSVWMESTARRNGLAARRSRRRR